MGEPGRPRTRSRRHGIALFVAALLLPAARTAATPAANPPPSNGKIAYVAKAANYPQNLHLQIWVVNPDGSDPIDLTFGHKDSLNPAWSPDGTKIAFDRGERIYVINADGTGLRRLTTITSVAPTWSPTGRRIAFQGPGGQLWVMRSDGTHARAVTAVAHDYYHNAAWSPVGPQIAFERGRYDRLGVYIGVMKPDGTDKHMLIGDGREPAWSPDGARVVFVRDLPTDSGGSAWHIFIANADGSAAYDLTPSDVLDFGPAWSPDGEFLAFHSAEFGCPCLTVVRPDGSDRHVVAQGGDPSWQPVWA